MKHITAATVVLYQPTNSLLDNIASYVNAVEKIYIIDNSASSNENLIAQITSLDSKIIYLRNNDNYGVGKALNQGATEAIKAGYKWLLTMDQDSKFEDVDRFFSCAESHSHNPDIAIFAPDVDIHYYHKDCEHQNPRVVITSGNLVNLKQYQFIGGFESKLFIDEIDHDFCLKLEEHNLEIMQFPGIHLHHAIGDETLLTSLILRRKKLRRIHGYQRIYYQTRNRLYMAKRHGKNYPEAFRFSSVLYKVIYKKVIRIIQWEPDKFRKLRAIYHGVFDYLNENYDVYDIDNRP